MSFIPVEDHSTILSSKNKCYSGCNKCINYDSPLEAPGTVINEKGASVMATYSNIESEYWEACWVGSSTILFVLNAKGVPITASAVHLPFRYATQKMYDVHCILVIKSSVLTLLKKNEQFQEF